MNEHLFQETYPLVCACIDKLKRKEPLLTNEYNNASKLLRSMLDYFVETGIISEFDTDAVFDLLFERTPQCIAYRHLADILSDNSSVGWMELPNGCWVKHLKEDAVICGILAPGDISKYQPETYEAAAVSIPRLIYSNSVAVGLSQQTILRETYRHNEYVLLGSGPDAKSAKAVMMKFMSEPMRPVDSKEAPDV